MHRILLVVLVVLVMGLAGGDPGRGLARREAPALPAACKRSWVVDLRPRATLYAVDVTPRDVWVAGGDGLVLHGAGKQWSATKIPGVDAIVDVASDGRDVWAIGTRRDRSGQETGDYLFRREGERWARIRVPGLPAARRGLGFSALDLRDGDIWLAGSYDNSDFEKIWGEAWLTARMHGGGWQLHVGQPRYAGLRAISVASSRDAWAVGTQGPTTADEQELILHWDGSRWVEMSHHDSVLAFSDVLAFGGGDAWAVGETNIDAFPEDVRKAAVKHWNGKRWERVGVTGWHWPWAPKLNSLAAFERRDVWAGGGRFTGAPTLLHWDGRRWRDVTPPPVKTAIKDLAAGHDGTLWAIGDGFIAHAGCG